MANVVKSDTTGEVLVRSDDMTSFKAHLILHLSPAGTEAIRLETPSVVVKRTSRNIVDNPEYQDFLADLAPLNAELGKLWTRFCAKYKERLDNKELM